MPISLGTSAAPAVHKLALPVCRHSNSHAFVFCFSKSLVLKRKCCFTMQPSRLDLQANQRV